MANYELPHSFTLNHTGENIAQAQSAGSSHPVQHPEDLDIGITRCIDATCGSTSTQPTLVPPAGRHANNYALEQHASKARHKSFLCTCTTKFVRLATLNRHIAAQAGPKHHCDYCDDNKSFARPDKLIDHLRASHKFGEKAIARIRGQGDDQPGNLGRGIPITTAADLALPATISAGNEAALGDVVMGQAGSSAGPAGFFDGDLNDFPSFNVEEFQPLSTSMDYPWLDAAGEFAGVDEDLDSFMNNNF
ncbi:hypothetical protein J7T55_009899 [Diaporthe amygdali]|uniref:uncharacterized protein n=1 Tax=Phomopsis amygdali TaxID=1214568 RepID=UPI0022FE320C|nr:uncharacterized protein J7T55_009899 [Diaporthe amygdali]KAJ0116749.1 hypothetical protein J7T55_009899 [Diaporthe amygdali]